MNVFIMCIYYKCIYGQAYDFFKVYKNVAMLTFCPESKITTKPRITNYERAPTFR